MVDIAAGRDAALELTADNAEVVTAAATPSTAPRRVRPFVPADSLAGQRRHALDADHPRVGIRDRREGAGGDEPAGDRRRDPVEVQLTPAVKVAARVLVADPARDVAVLWIDPEVVAAVRPVPLGCELAARPAVANGQEIFTIGAPIRGQKDLTSGTVSRVRRSRSRPTSDSNLVVPVDLSSPPAAA